MPLFNSKPAIEAFQAKRAAKKDAAPKGNTPMEMLVKHYDEKIGQLAARVARVESDVSGLQQFRSDQEGFNSQAKQRYAKQDKQLTALGSSAVGGRPCPECGETYPDGVVHWPGYTSTSHPGDPRCYNCFPSGPANG